MKNGNALDLPLSGISLNTSIVLDCMICSPKQSSIVHTCVEVDYYIWYLFYWSIPEDSVVLWVRLRTTILTTGLWDGSNPDRGYIYLNIFLLNWKYFISNRPFFASGKIYKQWYCVSIGLFPFHWHPHLSRVASKSGILLSLRHSAYTL